MVGILLFRLYNFVGDSLGHPRGVDESVLHAVALRHYGDDGEHVAVGVASLLGFEAHGVLDGLVTSYLVGGDVDEAHRLRGRDDRGNLLVDGDKLQFLVGVGICCVGADGRESDRDCHYGFSEIHCDDRFISWMLIICGWSAGR